MWRFLFLHTLLLLIPGTGLKASQHHSFEMQILVDGSPLPAYYHQGTTYIEALKNKEYTVRLTNPLGVRVAVALSVDGLNSIDARHTDAWSASKWVLNPYETITIQGWQMNQSQARQFFFTTEDKSYGAKLGKTQNLGVIAAVFFQEKRSFPYPVFQSGEEEPRMGASEREGSRSKKLPAPQASSADQAAGASLPKKDEYAATGIGRRTQHDVRWVSMELDPEPVARLNLRYEFRSVLTRLGVLPPLVTQNAIERRQRARGFQDDRFCPEPLD
ncbi:MAG: hypothetical protein AB1898_04495 [Acidobacteriota bacterium]